MMNTPAKIIVDGNAEEIKDLVLSSGPQPEKQYNNRRILLVRSMTTHVQEEPDN